jgi:hypothetical protein
LAITIPLFAYLGVAEYGWPIALLQTLFLLFWSYAGHAWCHSPDMPLYAINPHIQIHHNHALELPRWLNLVSEAIVNFFGFTILLLFEWLIGVKFLSTWIVLAAAFLYICMHILDYSIWPNPEHQLHHGKANCNYGPQFMDVIFNTRCDPTKPYDDFMLKIPHAIVSFALAFALRENETTSTWINGLFKQ